MFIHWGVYSVLGQGEWVMEQRADRARSTRGCRRQFNPAEVRRARVGGARRRRRAMKYITITSRHHDGFSMFGTKATRLQHRRLDAVSPKIR